MTEKEALELVKKLLRAADEEALMRLVSASLPVIDAEFFRVAAAAASQLERDGRADASHALRNLTDRMLRMKTLI
ncbi:MAG: hypothetical protein FJ011_19075 [Chloroflexi bacterium]|nr:hypothetical protein [Chloroflexota bacterium]